MEVVPDASKAKQFLIEQSQKQAKIAKSIGERNSFAFSINEETILAGISGFYQYGALNIEHLFVEEEHRGKGNAKQLLKQAIDLANDKKCKFLTATAMDWEDLAFYVKQGFFIEYERKGYDKNSKMFFLRKDLVSQNIENKPRFRCHIGVCMTIFKDDEVLLLRRANTGFGDGFYAFPGGSLDGDEPLTLAAIRETTEEVGIIFAKEDVELAQVVHSAANPFNAHELLLFVFKVENFKGSFKNMEPEKCDDLRFFKLNNLPENLIPGAKAALEAIQKGKIHTETHWND